jgi:hypothetical protein
MSRDNGGILLRGVFAISNWHTKPPSSVMCVKIHQLHLIVAHRQPALTPKDSVRRKSRTPIVVVVSFSTAFCRLIYPSAVAIWIAASDDICVFGQA